MQDLKLLRKTIPFKWRVQSAVPKNAPTHVQLIAYVDARDVAEHLDDIIGIGNWCDRYEEIKGNLFCSIGIKIEGEWVFKSDIGTESNQDKQKGESSDAFKRAAVKWGINRDAYRVGLVKLPCKVYGGKFYPVEDNGKFLKGQDLHDHCNKVAKIEDLENYTLGDHVESIGLDELKAMYADKVLNMDKSDIDAAERIINNQEVKSYVKLFNKLAQL